MSNDSPEVQVQSEAESPILHRVEVEVGSKRVAKAFDRAYRELAKQVNVKGFRPGKAPRSVLERLYGASLAEQLEQTLVAETLGEAIEQAGLEPVAEPAIESQGAKGGESFRYTARIEVKPAIELPDLAGLPAKRPRVEVTGVDVDQELEQLRERSAKLIEEPPEAAVETGHVVTVDFVGRIDGEPFEGGTGQGVEVEIGSGRFLPDFESQLVGATSSEDRELTVSFPEDYGSAELAGKTAVFAAHVVAIKRREVPELDDEFAKDLGDFDTLDDLRTRIRDDLERSREEAARSVLHRTLLDSLIERAPFDVPPGMVERRLEGELRSAHDRLAGQVDHDALHQQMAAWREEWRERAERQVREGLLLEAVARAESLSAAPEDIEARIEEMAERQGVSAARLRKAYGEEAFERALEAQLTDEKALEFLAARAKVEETTDT
ncbi:MAG: trigger factor [Myxococcota bacterium]|nr:trigger factor [Myxococcota bacterium]